MFDSKLELQLARTQKELTSVNDLDAARQKRRGMDAHLSTVDRRLEVCVSVRVRASESEEAEVKQ